ncbi:ATP-binding protein [Ammoniphilus sp. CFH 90114]|uniref:ATP-binding protein n=1 Tax=Ammoniphilus sp. CFH 90114 TaxID=2493665 RepID=UPI00100EF46A|nr:ATP-binding protein [Ammoniphilus sp. CFH 90114]RXT07186.1 sensor histidine kinase [Ammoniphilus sp. CFH 90114]
MQRWFNRFFPSSLSIRILLTLLFVALVPLLFFGSLATQFVKDTLNDTAEHTGEMISANVIALYQTNLQTQANLINQELKSIEQRVKTAKGFAEQLYREPHAFPMLKPVEFTREEQGYYWEDVGTTNRSNTGASGIVPLTPDLLERLSRSQYLEPFFQQSVESNRNIAAMYFILPESAWRIFPAIHLKKEVENEFFNPSIPVTSYSFYTQALPDHNPSKTIVWSDPYQDITHRSSMLTASSPVMGKQEELLGIVAVDITIDSIVQNILDTKFNHDSSFAFLINQSGDVIAIQEEGKESMSQISFTPMAEHANTSVQLPEGRVLLSAHIPATNWCLGYVIPQGAMVSPLMDQAHQEIRESGKAIVSQLSFAIGLLMLFCFGITFAMWKGVTTPLNRLLTGIHNVRAGNFKGEIPKSGISEFDQLSTSFNDMSKALEQSQNELLLLNNQLEAAIAERTEELVQRNRQLKEIEESRSALFSNISHDLKTPLTIITGYIEAIKDGLIAEDQQEIYLEKIQHRISSVNRLVHDLYELSLLETKTKSLDYSRVSVETLVNSLRSRWPSLQSRLEQTHSLLDVDLHQLYRVIDNLFENAQKYASDHPPVLKLESSSHDLYITVQDQGPGIPEEQLPFLFERSYRADKARNSKIPGNGLGLAIVKEIVQAHRGEINVRSRLHEGTSFTIRLPLVIEEYKKEGVS